MWVILIPALIVGCGGSPAGPPAPPAEIPLPVVLKFVPYEDIRINLSTISAASGTSINVYQAVGAGGEYSEAISFGPTWLSEFETFFISVTDGLNELEIPLSEETTTFQSAAIIGPQGGLAKIDFGDFDLDGDGTTEGCSGHTATLPVCARVWLNETRYLAWVFYEYAVEGNPGKSNFKIYTSEEEVDLISAAINFDHRDPENKSTEVRALAEGLAAGDDKFDALQHALVLQIGPDESALKRLNMSNSAIMSGVPWYSNLYLGQFIEGEDFWSGSFAGDNVFEFELAQFADVCARISTGNAAEDPNICDALGISVAGIPFIDSLDIADVAMPPDFPETPTF